jgi:hypothetical protein
MYFRNVVEYTITYEELKKRSFAMKNHKFSILAVSLILLAIFIAFTACEGPEGPRGPAGERGPDGYGLVKVVDAEGREVGIALSTIYHLITKNGYTFFIRPNFEFSFSKNSLTRFFVI